MAWSIVEYDSLHILYTDLNNDQYVIRKASTTAKELYVDSDDVSLIVDTHLTVFRPLPYYGIFRGTRTGPTQLLPAPWSATLRYSDAITPTSTSGADLVNKIYLLLRSANTKVEVNGTYIGQQSTVNFTEGDSVFISATADTVNDKINVVISSDETPKMLMLMGG